MPIATLRLQLLERGHRVLVLDRLASADPAEQVR
jgi:nucleoside-diphosphate-sugar epimerase